MRSAKNPSLTMTLTRREGWQRGSMYKLADVAGAPAEAVMTMAIAHTRKAIKPQSLT
jgi:hypothetical protein